MSTKFNSNFILCLYSLDFGNNTLIKEHLNVDNYIN